MKNIILSVVLLIAAAVVSQAQTVVLINGVPTKVKLSGTSIVEILGEVDNHMAGYPTKQSDFKYDGSDPIAASQIMPSSADGAVTSTPVTSPATVTNDPVTTQPRTSATAQPTIIGNYFKFDKNSALLSQLSINEIKDYSTKLTSGKASAVTLQSFYKTGNKRSEQLIKNRLDACKKYFELNGVSSSAITVEMLPNDKQSDKVSVTLN